MRKVVLISPRVSASRTGHHAADAAREPLGILSIGSFLKQNGYTVEILDTNLYPEAHVRSQVGRLVADKPIYVGLSVMTAQLPHALEISALIKRLDPTMPVVWGGVHPTLFAAQTSLDPRIDLIAYGPGESTALELARKFEIGETNWNAVSGIAYRGAIMPARLAEDLGDLPFLDYGLLDLKWYLGPAPHYLLSEQPIRALTVLSSRGCPWRCGFCVNVVTQNRWRALSAERFLDELEHQVKTYDLEAVRIVDEDFFVSKNRVTAIVEGMRARNLKLIWGTNVRANYFSDKYITADYARALAETGVKFLALGAESGSDEVLELLSKDIKVEQTIRSARVCAGAGIIPIYSWMIGIPGQSKQAMGTNLDLMNRLTTICPTAVQYTNWIFRPFPGGDLYAKCKALGLHEPASVEEWAHLGVDRERNTGFFAASDLPWVEDVGFVEFLSVFTPLIRIPSKTGKPPSFLRRVLSAIVRWLYKSWDVPVAGWFARQTGSLLRNLVLARRAG
ncbi:MAG: B12-binding domain-containing radical SAM protein [Chloroflexota bacterium]|nr:B12-binding domain-containing radical SAM protein [Chloroflexota bacterium]